MCEYCENTEQQSGGRFCPYCGRNLVNGRPHVETLCWSCKNAVPNSQYGCCWSRSLQPVDGWDAMPTVSYYSNGDKYRYKTPSYKVISCPHYITDSTEENEEEAPIYSKSSLTKKLSDVTKQYFSRRN